jgi:putative membrane protein
MQTIYLKSPMKEEFKKYIKKEKYNPDINKTEIWIGNFSNDPTIDPIDIICKIIPYFQNQDNKIIIDDYLQYNNGKHWQKNLIFRDITFNESVKFYYISFKDCVCFEKCIFKKEVSFSKCAFNEKVDFINCIFKERTNFRGVFFCSISDFSDTVFEGEQNNFSFIHSFEDFYCENINLKSSVDFSRADFKKTVSFERAVFEGEADFSNVEFGKYIRNDLEYSEYAYAFKKYIEKTAMQLKGLLKNTSKFIEIKNDENDENSFFSIIFNDAIFRKNAIFRESVFENMANFTNTKFEKLVDFHLVKFNKAQQFYSTIFLDRAIFSNTVFHEEAQFLYCQTDSNSYIGFESAVFKRSLDISRSNFNDKVNFWNIELEEGDIFTSSKYLDDFENPEEESKSTKNIPTIYKKMRETYRIIKSYFYSQNNRIEALEFSKKEMLVYEKEVKSLSTDKILLLANKFSNNYGTNWVKGLLFTMLTGFITYSTILYIEEKVNSTYSILLICVLFVVIMSKTENIKEILQKVFFVFFCCLYVIILCSCNTPFAINWELFIEHYLKVLNIIDLKPFEKEENSIFNLSGLSYLFLFIGRIFIGYGYYQTIQAFRKFGKS